MANPVDDRTGAIDYDAALMLDAEELAEQGFAAAGPDPGSWTR